MLKILFKKISFFNFPKFGFTLSFPENVWTYRKVSKNEIWFINIINNQAIILNCFDDIIYNINIIKSEFSNTISNVKIGEYDSFLVCKKFVKDSISQYEWVILDSGMKIKFSCSILDDKSEEEKDKDYEEVYLILNTIKKK